MMKGQPVRLTKAELRFMPPKVSELSIANVLERHWGVQGEIRPLSGERDQNVHVRVEGSNGYVFKVASPEEDRDLIELQIAALDYLEQNDPTLPVPRLVPQRSGEIEASLVDREAAYDTRLLTFVPGVPLASAPVPSREAIGDIGDLLGRVCHLLEGFRHRGARLFMPWNILNGLVTSDQMVREHLPAALQRDCAPVIERLRQESLPAMRALPHQIIHNDAHTGNIMVDPGGGHSICGLIDFGDMVEGPRVVDASTCLASLLERDADEAGVCLAFLEGYRRHVDFPPEQCALLRDAILARLILTVQLLDFRVVNGLEGGHRLKDEDLPLATETLAAMIARCATPLNEALADRHSSKA